MQPIGKILVIIGLVIIIIGIMMWLGGDRFNWLGHLPGDIRIEKENIKFYFPITTMIIISVVLTFLIWLFRKIF